ncbi:hypothetical protein IG631_07110 [Alternaria alternata]|nr:hypothetical protein IG631_07110 [Alternaria alternata]
MCDSICLTLAAQCGQLHIWKMCLDATRSRITLYYTTRISPAEKKAFVVHSKAIAATSWHFQALVNNGMGESQEGSVEYPDMNPHDFARFVEYAYRCDYTAPSWALDKRTVESNDTNGTAQGYEDAPSPTKAELQQVAPSDWEMDADQESEPVPVPVELEPELTPVHEPVQNSGSEGWGLSKAYKKKLKTAEKKTKSAKKTYALRKSFDERSYLTPNEPKTAMLNSQMPESNTALEQDFTPVFLAHARLYTFACMRLIDPLKRLTLHKLHRTLHSFRLYNQRVGDVIELARYAYDHGENRKSDGTIEELRKLVVEYIACEVSTIGKHEAFMPLLQEGGEFVVDFWRIIATINLGL